jgi:hypothetical protein
VEYWRAGRENGFALAPNLRTARREMAAAAGRDVGELPPRPVVDPLGERDLPAIRRSDVKSDRQSQLSAQIHPQAGAAHPILGFWQTPLSKKRLHVKWTTGYGRERSVIVQASRASAS